MVTLKGEGVVVDRLRAVAEEERLQQEVEVVIQPVQLDRESLDLASAAGTERNTADNKQHICNKISNGVQRWFLQSIIRGISSVRSIGISAGILLVILSISGVVGCLSVVGSWCWTSSRRLRSVSPIRATMVVSATVMVAAAIAIATVTTLSAVSTIASIATRWSVLELLVLLLHVGNEVFAKLLCLLNHGRIRATKIVSRFSGSCTRYILRHMKEHLLIAFHVSIVFNETGSTSFDLNTTSSFLLNVFHV